MLSTPSNPYLYRFDGKIPALKNGKEISAASNGKLIFRSNPEVTAWYNNQPFLLQSDIAHNKQFDKLVRPFCVLELYERSAVYPLDTDNVYTTVQELMQPPDPKKREKGFLAIVDDDKWVQCHCVFTYDLCKEMPTIGAFLWAWETTSDHPVNQQMLWLMHRDTHLQRYKRQTSSPMFGE